MGGVMGDGNIMDEGDIAQDYQSRLNQDAIERHRRRSQSAGPGAESCEECGVKIPQARRAAQPGCTLCVDCQTVAERLKGGL